MGNDVVGLDEVDGTMVELVGGKGAQLGALRTIGGARVPSGFCVTTTAYRRALTDVPELDERLDRLAALDAGDRRGIAEHAAAARAAIEATAMPADVVAAITSALAAFGDDVTFAVRSSATAEDLPTASFAGQQDTYLNVPGAAVVDHVRRCWASLHTERAVAYRLRQGIDHRAVHMAVVVQQLIAADASGVLFTADPVTGNRTVAVIEAVFGLGEALVSGVVDPDVCRVRHDAVVERTTATQRLAITPSAAGGTATDPLDAERAAIPVLTDDQVLRLAALGRRIEAHLGTPQDIEWCLSGDDVHVVQSRPITTLFPVPTHPDGGERVYLSVGHQQMMTDAMRPLGWSMWQMTAMAPMHEAGSRLFVDVTPRLASPATRGALVAMMGQHDPLFRDALTTVIERDGFLDRLEAAAPAGPPGGRLPVGGPPATIETDPAIVDRLVERSEASLAALLRDLAPTSGPTRFTAIRDAIAEHRHELGDPLVMQAISAGMEAAFWLNEHVAEWLGEKNVADALTRSAPGNVTSEMGLALLDVADAIRPHPEVVAFLEGVTDDGFLDGLDSLDGGPEARAALEAYLDRYGMRCVGEIDITRPRWRERPATLVPVILDHVRNFGPGVARQRFEEGARTAARTEADVLARLRALPDGEAKAAEAKRMIDRVRAFAGYREHPKYAIVGRHFVYKQALLDEIAALVRAGVLDEADDAWFLTFDELEDAARTHHADRALIRRRREAFRAHRSLTPPRVLTSDGEAIVGALRRDDVPAGALAGVAVSAGTVEGRARVVLDLADADLEPGDILVTAFTDPSWSPLFVAVAGLVTEVGGTMTHGAVVAREYGLPAVVGVQDATRRIADGRRIRVHGADGFVELLD